MATLNLPTGVRAAVWRLVKAQLQNDPTLQSADVTLLFFDGEASRQMIALQADIPKPNVIFLATLGRMSWFNEQAQSGALVISYRASIDSTDDEDLLNLQEAIEGALYPADSFAFHQSLVDAGAVTGQPAFLSPLSAQQNTAGVSGLLQPTGQIVIEVARPLGP